MLETQKNTHTKKTRTKHVTNIHIQEGGVKNILNKCQMKY